MVMAELVAVNVLDVVLYIQYIKYSIYVYVAANEVVVCETRGTLCLCPSPSVRGLVLAR